MALRVGCVVGQRAQREGVFVDVLRAAHQVHHEVAAADVVHQIAEKTAAERIIADVLKDAAGVSIGVCVDHIGGGGLRESA